MDKKQVVAWYKKCVIFCALLFSVFCVIGCQTAKGIAQGVGSTAEGTVVGAAKDVKSLAGAIMAADDWIKRNIW